MYKKIIFKISAIILLIVILNFIYSKWFYENDLQKHSKIINLVRAVPNDADIIYLAESSNITVKDNDDDKRPISDFIGDYFKGLNIYHITKPASHGGIYKVLLHNIPKDNNAKTIVVTLNLRSFNAQWIHSKLETSLQKSLVLIKPYPPIINRFLLSFKVYDIKTDQERENECFNKWQKDKFHFPYDFEYNDVVQWDTTMANNGLSKSRFNNDYSQVELACHYIKSYGFQIDTLTNPRIKDFNEIVEYAKERKWNLVFNLLAENTQKAKSLVGEDLVFLMNDNALLLSEYYQRKGVTIVNNLNSVSNDCFRDQNWTTEHYNEKGRKIIAKNVADKLRIWHEKYFEIVNYKKIHRTSFSNNCDKDVIWGQMQTITTEKAYSGDKSSVTGDGEMFGLGIGLSFKALPDSLKNNISIEMMVLQTSKNHNAKLILEANGDSMEYYFKEFDIKKQVTKTNKWMKYSINISIPEEIKQAEIVKIYMYNKSKEKVYVDDIIIDILPEK